MKKEKYTAIVKLPLKSGHPNSVINKCMCELQHKEIVLTKLHNDLDYDFIDLNVYYFSYGKWIIKKATNKNIDMLNKKRTSEKKGIFELIDGCMWRSEWLTDITKLTKHLNP